MGCEEVYVTFASPLLYLFKARRGNVLLELRPLSVKGPPTLYRSGVSAVRLSGRGAQSLLPGAPLLLSSLLFFLNKKLLPVFVGICWTLMHLITATGEERGG